MTSPADPGVSRLARRHRRAALLAWLALGDGMGRRRDKALALFWPELDGPRARAALSQSLYVLRETIGAEALVSSPHEVGLNAATVWCDAVAFEDAVAGRRAADALSLYRGDLLDGFFIAGAPEFEHWLDEQRARLRGVAAEAAWSLADQAAAARDAPAAARWGWRAAALQPADETAARRLMTLLDRVGDRAAALRAYAAYARTLATEYEIEPSEATRTLARTLRQAESAGHSRDAAAVAAAPDARATTRQRDATHGARVPVWSVMAVLAAALVGAAVLALGARFATNRSTTAGGAVLRFTLDHPLATGRPGPPIALSPAGDRLAWVGQGPVGTQLYLREMDALDAAAIPHTDGAERPFFAPDGAHLGFITGGSIRRVALADNDVREVVDAGERIAGAAWTDEGEIVFATSRGVWRIPARGGTARLVAPGPAAPGARYASPEALPGTDYVLLTRVDAGGAAIVSLSLSTGRIAEIAPDASNPRFVPPDRLVFTRPPGAALVAPFDAGRARIVGPATPLDEPLSVEVGGVAMLAVSRNGHLAYPPGGRTHLLVEVDGDGAERKVAVPRDGYTNARLSPDKTALATTIGPAVGLTDVWVIDLRTGARRRITSNGRTVAAIWAPDGDALVAATHAAPDRGFALRRIPLADPDAAYTVVPPARGQMPNAVTPDGGTLIFVREDPRTRGDLWSVPLDGTGRAEPLIASAANERGGALSPAGDRIAYVSDATGRDEIHVAPFPLRGDPVQVSQGGGREPRWSSRGDAVIYRADDGLTAAALDPHLHVRAHSRLFDDRPYLGWTGHAIYDVLPDDRFLMIRRAPDRREIVLVLNRIQAGQD